MLRDVAAFDGLEEGRTTIVAVGLRELAIVRWKDSVYAVRNVCPHQNQPFTSGIVRPRLSGSPAAPGVPEIDDSDPVIVCPVHTWEFSARTGQCIADKQLRVRSYPVHVEDGRVFIDM